MSNRVNLGHYDGVLQIDETNNKQSFLASARNRVTQIFHSLVGSLQNVPTFFCGLKGRVTAIFSTNSNKAATNPQINSYSNEHVWLDLDIDESKITKEGFFKSLTEKFISTACKIKNKASNFFTLTSTRLKEENNRLNYQIQNLEKQIYSINSQFLAEKLLRAANLGKLNEVETLNLFWDITWFYNYVVEKAYAEIDDLALLNLLKLDLYRIKNQTPIVDHSDFLKRLLVRALRDLSILGLNEEGLVTHPKTNLYIGILTTLIGHPALVNSTVEVEYDDKNQHNLRFLGESWNEIKSGNRLERGQQIIKTEDVIKSNLQNLEHKITNLRFQQVDDKWIFIIERNDNP